LIKSRRAELGLAGADGKQGEAIEFLSPEPWPAPVYGAELLDEIADAVRKHVVMTSDAARDAYALWAVHAHLIRHFAISPKLFVRSPGPRCGKSTSLEVLSLFVARPLLSSNITTATVFRIIDKYQPTLLIDEFDTFLRDNDELRGVMNASHRHDGRVARLVGEDHEPCNFKVYTAVAFSGIGSLHATLMDRSIISNLKRRKAGEQITPLRAGKTSHLDEIARRIVRWIADNEDRIAAIEPVMPDGLGDREADNWLPLLVIAEAAGGNWPERARKAAQATCAAAGDSEDWLELLLADIRGVFYPKVEEGPKVEEMASADLSRR
jgi:hypothetical protein